MNSQSTLYAVVHLSTNGDFHISLKTYSQAEAEREMEMWDSARIAVIEE